MNDLFSLAGKNILITGSACGSGIYWQRVSANMARRLSLTILRRNGQKPPSQNCSRKGSAPLLRLLT